MCHNDELNSMMSWIGCLLKDSEHFIFVAENSQILLKISVIPILLTFIYLVALNLLVNNQLNTSSNSTHHCGTLWQFCCLPDDSMAKAMLGQQIGVLVGVLMNQCKIITRRQVKKEGLWGAAFSYKQPKNVPLQKMKIPPTCKQQRCLSNSWIYLPPSPRDRFLELAGNLTGTKNYLLQKTNLLASDVAVCPIHE